MKARVITSRDVVNAIRGEAADTRELVKALGITMGAMRHRLANVGLSVKDIRLAHPGDLANMVDDLERGFWRGSSMEAQRAAKEFHDAQIAAERQKARDAAVLEEWVRNNPQSGKPIPSWLRANIRRVLQYTSPQDLAIKLRVRQGDLLLCKTTNKRKRKK